MQNPTLYGALYLDRGERMPKAVEQVMSLRDKARSESLSVKAFAFDVLFSEKQKQNAMAKRYVADVETAIHDAFADSDDDMVVVVVASPVKSTAADGPRPAREFLLKWIEDGGEAAADYLRSISGET